MNDIVLAFVTGLTTGGLSCLAVQGGLLATSIARQVEQDLAQQNVPADLPKVRRRKARGVAANRQAQPRQQAAPQRLSLPILLFLGAKLVAYTILGFLLGSLGSFLQLTPLTRAVLQIAIGIFMVGSALRMLDVHPIFRYFAIEPPKTVTRYIRRTAKQSADVVTPAFLGLLTVLIPCGVTQAMMALALGTGTGSQGAAIMFAFTLGTTPVFFTLAYLATRLGAALEKRFALVAAIVLLALGLYSVDSALNLAGSPISVSAALNARSIVATTQNAPSAAPSPVAAGQTEQTLTIYARTNGYEPTLVRAQAGMPTRLAVVTNRTYSCSRAFVIPALNVQRLLPETGTEWITIPPQKAGTTINFTCSMGMYTGKIQFF